MDFFQICILNSCVVIPRIHSNTVSVSQIAPKQKVLKADGLFPQL